MFVLDDGDVALAAKAAWFGATLNAGQTCLAVRRVFVSRKVYQPFLATLEPLTSAAAPMHLALPAAGKLAADLVQQALKQGARVLGSQEARLNGELGNHQKSQPVVLADARPDMAICRDATFAPVMAVIPFDRLEEAIPAHEGCPYGLGLSVFTSQPRRAARLAQRLQVGMVSVNDVIAATGHPATPFGGRRASGWGVTQGAQGLLEMTVPQVFSTRSGRFRPHYDPAEATLMTRRDTLENLLRWQYGGSLGNRAKSVWRLMRRSLGAIFAEPLSRLLRK
jgi:acyl-CoA reductase-like NAD-dependent aldehyde dehydrogenase